MKIRDLYIGMIVQTIVKSSNRRTLVDVKVLKIEPRKHGSHTLTHVHLKRIDKGTLTKNVRLPQCLYPHPDHPISTWTNTKPKTTQFGPKQHKPKKVKPTEISTFCPVPVCLLALEPKRFLCARCNQLLDKEEINAILQADPETKETLVRLAIESVNLKLIQILR